MKYSFMHKIFFALITVANVVSAAATVISPLLSPVMRIWKQRLSAVLHQ